MEEKDHQPSDNDKPEKPQLPQAVDTSSAAVPFDQTISPQEPATGITKQYEPEKPVTHNPQPETTDMEVHHHSHAHGKKTWKAYFWEFLMLFLAVFCGFLAEYQLEHKIEKDREIQYMKTLVEDLKADTTNYNTTLMFWKQTDSVIVANRPFVRPPVAEENIIKAYRLAAAL